MYVVPSAAGTSLSFSHEDSSLVVVGCGNGCLLKCSVQTDADLSLDSDLGWLLAAETISVRMLINVGEGMAPWMVYHYLKECFADRQCQPRVWKDYYT